MDAYEKLFLKMETERKLTEKEEAKQEFNGKTIEEKWTPVNLEDKEKPLKEKENDKKHYVEIEDKRKKTEEKVAKKEQKAQRKEKKDSLIKHKRNFGYLSRFKLNKKPSNNGKPEKKPNVQLKVFKFSKAVSSDEIIPIIRAKETQSKGYVLVIDNNFDDNNFKKDILIKIKKIGIDYIIASDFAVGFCKQAVDLGIHLMKCSNAKLIDSGNDIEVYLEEGVIFDFDNGQEYKFRMMTNSLKRRTVQEMCLGECLIIGDNLRIKILDIDNDQIKLCVNALKVITIHLLKSTPISDEIKIQILKINFDHVKLVIKAPESVTILKE